MQKLTALLAISVLAFGAVAGCANNGTTPTPTPTGTPTPTPTPTATPSPTVVPTVTPPTTPPTVTPPVPPTILPSTITNVTTPTISAVYVVSLTDRAAAGGAADVCWRVEGNGTVGHTAVHFDTVSHPNATAFADYAGGAVYPNNSAPTTTGTFPLPGTFCGQIRDLNATTYLRAHALAAGPPASQLLSAEKVVPVNESRNITFADGFREIAQPGTANNVCWSVSGLTGTTTHTAIHFDNVSHPNGTFADYAGGAVYPDNAAPTGLNVTVPGTFCANVTMPASGSLYLVAHVIFEGAHFHSEERNVAAASRLSITGGLPALASAGGTVNVCWRAEGSGTTTHTAIHWDTVSHPNSTAFADYAGGAYYPANAAPTGGPWTLPGPFCAAVTMPASGALYFRPHAIFDGGFSDLGPEYSIRVGP